MTRALPLKTLYIGDILREVGTEDCEINDAFGDANIVAELDTKGWKMSLLTLNK
jgi:hypothetical protein